MVELFDNQIVTQNRKSSKGNQLKWYDGQWWYKADYAGYEGLTEYVISQLLKKSSLDKTEFVDYELEEIKYKSQIFLGCKSKNLLSENSQMITLERLFQNHTSVGLNKSIFSIQNHTDRLKYLVEQTERMTGLTDFGKYMCKMLTVDTFFLNEDRHTHNIAVLMDGAENYQYCPIFDNGAGLLSDTKMDYPMQTDVYTLENEARAKTFCQDFDEQLDIVENLYGQQVEFYFTHKDVEEILKEVPYSEEIKQRVSTLIRSRMHKFGYLMK